MNKKNGYVTALASIISVAILLVFSAIYHYLSVADRGNLVIDNSDKNVELASSGVQEVVRILHANTNLPQLNHESLRDALLNPIGGLLPDPVDGFFNIYRENTPHKIFKHGTSVPIGNYSAKVKSLTWAGVLTDEAGEPINGQIYHLMVKGWGEGQDPRGAAIIHTYVYLPNIGTYFMAIKGALTIGPGANLGNVKMYGQTLNFPYISPPNPATNIVVGEAQYLISYTPNSWPNNGSIQIKDSAGVLSPTQLPKQVPAPLVFPGIIETVAYYANASAAFVVPAVGGICIIDGGGGDLEPPNALNPSNPFAYYCNGTAQVGTVGSTLWVKGQVIIAAQNGVVINGNIKIRNGPPNPLISFNYPNLTPTGITPNVNGYPAVNESKADQLVIYARNGIQINPNWCSPTPAAATLDLSGVVLYSPDSGITNVIGPIPPPTCPNITNYVFNFQGAMYFAAQPQMSLWFGTRNYNFLPTLLTDPPPTREYYQFLRWIVFRHSR